MIFYQAVGPVGGTVLGFTAVIEETKVDKRVIMVSMENPQWGYIREQFLPFRPASNASSIAVPCIAVRKIWLVATVSIILLNDDSLSSVLSPLSVAACCEYVQTARCIHELVSIPWRARISSNLVMAWVKPFSSPKIISVYHWCYFKLYDSTKLRMTTLTSRIRSVRSWQ